MLYKGDKKLSLWQGERKPYSLFKGGKQIAGAVKTSTTKWESLYKAKIPKVEVDGMGFQGFKTGKNLADWKSGIRNSNLYTVEELSDGGFHVKGETTYIYETFILYPLKNLKPGVYHIGGDIQKKPNNTGSITIQAHILRADDNWQYFSNRSFEVLPSDKRIRVTVQLSGKAGVVDAIVYPQLEEGSVATEYEPYWSIGDRPALEGNNILPFPYLASHKEHNGLTFDVLKDGGIKVKGTPTANAYIVLCNMDFGESFAFWNPKGVTNNGKYTFSKRLYYNSSNKITSFEYYPSDGEVDEIVYPMIVKGVFNDNNFPPYEPYCGGTPAPNPYYPIEPVFNANSKLEVKGKNLIPFPYTDGSHKEINGITFDVKSDGSVVANGTATDFSYFFLWYDGSIEMPIKQGMSIWDNTLGSYNAYEVQVYGGADDNNYAISTAGRNVAEFDFTAYWIRIIIRKGYTANNLVFKPILLEGSEKEKYEPYTSPQQIDVPILRAIPDTEYKDIYNPQTQTITRRVGELIATGEERWRVAEDSKGQCFRYADVSVITDTPNNNGISNSYLGVSRDYQYGYTQDMMVSCNANSIRIVDSRFKTAEEFKSHLREQYSKGTPIKIWYVLETPVEEKVTTPPLVQNWSGELKATWGDCGVPEVRAEVFTEFMEVR